MDYTTLDAAGLAAMIANRAAAWPPEYGYGWYIFTNDDEGPALYEDYARGDEHDAGRSARPGLNPPAKLALASPSQAECYFRCGSPELMLAIGTGADPWVSATALHAALRLDEEDYVSLLMSRQHSEARAALVAELRRVLPELIEALRAQARADDQMQANLARRL